MKFHKRAVFLVVAVSSATGLTSGAGVAAAQPSPPPVPSVVDQPPPSPTLWPNPDYEGGPWSLWPGFGAPCGDQWLICRH
jgi:hypothetical protein